MPSIWLVAEATDVRQVSGYDGVRSYETLQKRLLNK